jgi:hypothetical protein
MFIKRRQWEQILGTAGPGFDEALARSLAAITEDRDVRAEARATSRKSSKGRRVPLRLAFALAAILVLMGGTIAWGNASHWGILDFLNRQQSPNQSGNTTTPQAASLIVSDPAQQAAHTDWADFYVEEYVFDGERLFATVSVTPTDDDTLLLPESYGSPGSLLDAMSQLTPYYASNPQGILDYVTQNNIRPLRVVFDKTASLRFAQDENSPRPAGTATEVSAAWGDNGTLTLFLEISVPHLDVPIGSSIKLPFSICPIQIMEDEHGRWFNDSLTGGTPPWLLTVEEGYTEEGEHFITSVEEVRPLEDATDVQDAMIVLTLDSALQPTILVNSEPLFFKDYGLMVDEARITTSAFGTFVRVRGHLQDANAYGRFATDGGKGFSIMPYVHLGNAAGEQFSSGVAWGLSLKGTFLFEIDAPAFETLPDELTVELTHDVATHPVEGVPSSQSLTVELRPEQ